MEELEAQAFDQNIIEAFNPPLLSTVPTLGTPPEHRTIEPREFRVE